MKKILCTALLIAIIAGALAGCSEKSDEIRYPDGSSVIEFPKGTSENNPPDNSGENNPPDSSGGNTPPDSSSGMEIPKGLDGIETAKLILANERLNSQLFKDNDSIFLSGSTAFASLYTIAEANMLKYSGSADYEKEIVLLSTVLSDESFSSDDTETHTLSNGSVFQREGNAYRWSEFGEYSNSYDYFLNITNNVKSSAEVGARLIDDTKKFVRIVDTWVKIDTHEYYLHVEDDTEIIYCRSEGEKEICRRYKRADGVNVYELYRNNSDGGSSRMVYIPGEKYEYSYIYNDFNHNFLAENTKGFWEVVDVGQHEFGYNVSCMVLKNDICYDSFYDANFGKIGRVKVISPDKKTDIMDIDLCEGVAAITLKLQAFEGVDYVEFVSDTVVTLGEENPGYYDFVYRYEVPENPEQKEHTVYFAASNSCTVALDNGLFLNVGDSFLDEKVTIHAVRVEYFGMEGFMDGYVSTVDMDITGESYDEIMNTLEEFLGVTGLECTRDFKVTREGITQAYTELAQMTKYHTWNESLIATVEDLNAGYANNLAKHESFSKMFDAIADAEVVDFDARDAVEIKIKFAPITAQSSTEVKNDGLTVSVSDLSLSVEDTLLFVEGEKYTVNFAIVGTTSNTGLIHIEAEGTLSTEYKGEKQFEVSQTAILNIPVIAAGEYTLVAYISTEDGIRSSGYLPVAFTELIRYEEKYGNVNVVLDKNEKGELLMNITEELDIEVTVEFSDQTVPAYADMFAALEKEAYLYGFGEENSVLEFSADEIEWIALTGEETVLESGNYRLKYSIKNGESISEGYVYAKYAPKVTEITE